MTDMDILNDFLECSACADFGVFKHNFEKMDGRALVDFMLKYLPGIEYHKDQMLNYIFSNGLTTGSLNADKVLEAWLFDLNNQGATNYAVLREAIGIAAVYGECGVRWLDGHIYIYRPGKYAVLYDEVDGIKMVEGFIIRKDGEDVLEDFDTGRFETIEELRAYYNESYVLLGTDEFINIRNDISQLHGESPFSKDQLRLKLLLYVYERLNYDIVYDGPGRLVVRPRDGILNGGNEVSTNEVLNSTMEAREQRNDKAKEELKRVAREIKDSSSDSIILLSNAFDKDIEHLPRVTKATEFFDWLEQEGVILAQDLGMSPSLLEVGNISGNVSMEKIIDNSMLNNIVPLREKYAIQFSTFIASHLGVEKVYFNKYQMQQAEDESETRKRISETMVNISRADHFEGNNAHVEVIDHLAQQLDESLFDENNELRDM